MERVAEGAESRREGKKSEVWKGNGCHVVIEDEASDTIRAGDDQRRDAGEIRKKLLNAFVRR